MSLRALAGIFPPMLKMVNHKSVVASAVGGVAFLLAGNAAHAQTGAPLLLKPFPKEEVLDTHADAYFLDNGKTENGGDDFRLSAYETQGRVRLIPGEIASPRIGWDFTYLELHSNSPVLPDQLVDQSFGAAFPVAKYGDWTVAAGVGIGYAGNSPFGDGDGWYGKGTIVVFKQPTPDTALVFILDYDGNRTYLPDVPLPGFAYTGKVSDELFFTVGLPVSGILWKPNDRLSIEASYTLPYTIDAEIRYEVVKHLNVYGKLENRSQAFFLDGLPANYDRVIFEQRRAEIGVSWEPKENMFFDIAIGYAWGGEFSTGFDARETDELTDVSDEPFIKAGFEMKF